MKIRRTVSFARLLVLAASLLALAAPAAGAQVYFTSPAEGAAVAAGSEVTVAWSISVAHGPGATYDVLFSKDGGA